MNVDEQKVKVSQPAYLVYQSADLRVASGHG